MTRKTVTVPMLRGHAPHRRTQADYMAALLDRVPLETWGEVIDVTIAKAKEGDAPARAWLAAYLVGKPTAEAQTPLAVTAARLRGEDPLVQAVAVTAISRQRFPLAHLDDDGDDDIRNAIAAELPEHIQP
ncbi:MAG: hypothetical protein EPN40_12170 [Rhodanobacteraceae bacterium]|nr:MAG: hypothetical protein EPN40_12170 [Rhodanobacteraceae bacterium]